MNIYFTIELSLGEISFQCCVSLCTGSFVHAYHAKMVHSRDVQCNTEESPDWQLFVNFYAFYFFYYQGTEVKAITYSNMQVHDNDDKHEVYVIIDI